MVASDFILFVVIFFLSALLLIQHFFFLRQIQKLIDKLMSRDFSEYNAANKKVIEKTIKIPSEPAEDLRTLQTFMG